MAARDLIVFADDWGRYPSTIQYLGRVLAERHRIIWVGSLGLRKPEFHARDAARVVEKVSGLFRRRSMHGGNAPVFEVHPFILPYHDLSWLRRVNLSKVANVVRREAARRSFVDPILVTASPLIGEIVDSLGTTSCHYICLDDFSEFAGAFECLRHTERMLVERSATVFAVSDVLRASRTPPSGRNYFLPQGVDTDHFTRRDGTPPPMLRSLPRPWIGFFGILAPWIDQDLLIRVARSHPKASLILLGRSSTTTDRLRAEPNIHLLGEVPYEQLPQWSQWFDVGLIPFVVNDLTIAANPLKLLEYLSLGLPVVSTDLPEVRKFIPHLRVAEGPETFVRAVADALEHRSADGANSRRAKAVGFSWRTIADDIMGKILEADEADRLARGGR